MEYCGRSEVSDEPPKSWEMWLRGGLKELDVPWSHGVRVGVHARVSDGDVTALRGDCLTTSSLPASHRSSIGGWTSDKQEVAVSDVDLLSFLFSTLTGGSRLHVAVMDLEVHLARRGSCCCTFECLTCNI